MDPTLPTPRAQSGALPARTRLTRAGAAGFTFIEMIVGLAIMVLVASTVTPSLLGVLDRERRDAALASFTSITGAITAFVGDVGTYPGQLSHLTTQIVAQPDLCEREYTLPQRGNWRGPYLTRYVPATGLPISVGRARNQLTRFPNTNDPTHIVVTVDSVVVEDALALNKTLDDDGDDSTANAVRWTTLSAADGLVTLAYWGPIADVC